MQDTSTCKSDACGIVTTGSVRKCPACGGPVVQSRVVCIMGWLRLVIGCALALGFAALLWSQSGALSRQTQLVAGTKAESTRIALRLFWALLAFGLLSAVAGWRQISTRRESKAFNIAMAAVVAAILIMAIRIPS